MTDYGPTDEIVVVECQHCWHLEWNMVKSTGAVQRRICCHCGLREFYQDPPPPIPDGHGPHYPRDIPWTFTTSR